MSDRITIRSGKEVHFVALFSAVAVLFVSWILYIEDVSLFILYGFSCLAFILIALYWIATGRTIVLEPDGAEISFLWIKRKYSWDQLLTKQFFKCENGLGFRIPYTDGIELCHRKVSRPSWIKPMQYNFIFHPFAYIVIHFPPINKTPIKYPALYEVDRKTLVNAIKKWGLNSTVST